MGMNLFAQISKVDEQKRLVYGRAAQEMVDKADEVMDYESSKPHFQKWSEDVQKDTDGKSMGNVRAMHGKVAAGKLTDISFNDGDKAVDVVAKIVDDGEWKKVLEGVYTGFSIGGSYVGDKKVEKVDDRDVTRYTAKPSEISLVDRPCIPSAKFFEVQKADGSLQKVEFQSQDEAETIVNGTEDDVLELGKVMNDLKLSVREVIAKLQAKEEAPPVKGKKKKDMAAEGDEDGDEGAEAEAEGDDDGDEEGDEEGDEDFWSEKLEHAAGKLMEKAAAGSANEKAKAAVAKLQKAMGMGSAEGDAIDPAQAYAEVMQKVDERFGALQKLIDTQADTIKKLSEMPAPTTVRLRAVAKGEDLGKDEAAAPAVKPIVDDLGKEHDAATLIKFLHTTGGAPLAMPASLRQ